MDNRIPPLNRKLYRTPRARFTANNGGLLPRIAGRAALYQNQYAPKTHTGAYRIVKIAIIIIAIVLVAQSFFQVPYFRITDVQIQGLKYIPIENVRSFIDAEMNRRRLLIFRNNNYFIFSKSRMKQRLQNAFYLDVQDLHTVFPHSLIIKVRERISAFAVQTPTGYFTLGTDGKALTDETKPLDTQLVIADERSTLTRSVPLNYLETATNLAEDWQQTVVGVKLAAFHLTDDTSRLIVSTDKGFQVFIDPAKDLHQQLLRLSIYLQDRSYTPPKQYIDMRYDDKVYPK